MSFTNIIVTGTYHNADSTPASGTVTFALSSVMQQSTRYVSAGPVSVTLDNTGSFSATLVANDDTVTTATGVQGYMVTETLKGCAPRTYRIVIPHSVSGGTVNLAALPQL